VCKCVCVFVLQVCVCLYVCRSLGSVLFAACRDGFALLFLSAFFDSILFCLLALGIDSPYCFCGCSCVVVFWTTPLLEITAMHPSLSLSHSLRLLPPPHPLPVSPIHPTPFLPPPACAHAKTTWRAGQRLERRRRREGLRRRLGRRRWWWWWWRRREKARRGWRRRRAAADA
jgi:hypothetical protein